MYAQQHAGMVRVGCLSLSCNEAVVGASHDLTPSPAPATRVYTQEELKQLYLLQQQKKSATTSFSVPSTLYGLHHTQHPIQAPYGGQATYGGGGDVLGEVRGGSLYHLPLLHAALQLLRRALSVHLSWPLQATWALSKSVYSVLSVYIYYGADF